MKRLRDYGIGEAEWADGNLILATHPGGGYVFGVADAERDIVVFGDTRLWVCDLDYLIYEKQDTDPAVGLLIGRRFQTAEEAIAAAEPYEK